MLDARLLIEICALSLAATAASSWQNSLSVAMLISWLVSHASRTIWPGGGASSSTPALSAIVV
jgi:hypothetical protein